MTFEDKFVLFIETDDNQRTVKVMTARNGKSMEFNEREINFLADALILQIREWSKL